MDTDKYIADAVISILNTTQTDYYVDEYWYNPLIDRILENILDRTY
jgi:hypothetical protein